MTDKGWVAHWVQPRSTTQLKVHSPYSDVECELNEEYRKGTGIRLFLDSKVNINFIQMLTCMLRQRQRSKTENHLFLLFRIFFILNVSQTGMGIHLVGHDLNAHESHRSSKETQLMKRSDI